MTKILNKSQIAKNLWGAFGIFFIGVFLSFSAYFLIKIKIETHQLEEFKGVCSNVKVNIENKLNSRELILKNLSAFLSLKDTVTREEWKLYLEKSGINKDSLKSIGTGYNVLISKNQLQNHIQQIKNEGFPNYTITPAGDRDFYTPVIYLEPFEKNNLKAFGYDTYSEKSRREAMNLARDNGIGILTSALEIVQDSIESQQASTIFYIPVYHKNMTLNTVEERRAAIKGWTSSPYHISDLMDGIFKGSQAMIGNKNINLKIYENESLTNNYKFFDSQGTENDKNELAYSLLIPLKFNNQKWTLSFSQYNEPFYFVKKIYFIVLISGLTVSTLLFLLYLLISNTGIIAQQKVKSFKLNLLNENKEFLNLYKENKKFFTAVEQSANTIVITDTNGVIEYTNPKFTEVTGFTAEEVLGKKPSILKSEIQTTEFYQELWKTISDGNIWKGEFQNKNKNGKIFREQATISPIRNDEGEIINYLAIKEDISALRKNEQRLKTLINATPDAIYFKDSEGRWEEVNMAGLELFGLKDFDYKGKTDKELANATEFYKESLLYCEKSDTTTWETKTVTKTEEVIPTINGESIVLDTIKVPLFNNDNSKKGLVVIARDITKQKLADIALKEQNQQLIIAKNHAEESDNLKTEFLNNMSHEIRTPLNGILGFSDMLSNPDLDDKKRQNFVNIIQNSGKQLLHIIDDILEISSLGTKQVKVVENKVCLNDLLLELFSIFEIKAIEQKNPLYIKKGLSDKQSTIITDETKLNKVLGNLMENALKFTLDGFIELGYELKNNEIEIYVKDTGIGIEPEKHNLIFKRFSQAEKDLSKNVGGLGLGLSIAKENTELLGGKIRVESNKGEGATFFVTIPYKPVFIDLNEQDNIKKQTILIVEDVEVNYLYLETLLKDIIKLDCNLLHAKNGQEAIEICKNNLNIDLVFMDLKMSVMNGYDATRQLKELFPNLIIIAQSAYTTSAEKNKAISVGCDDFIVKPINLQDVQMIINKYLNEKAITKDFLERKVV